MGQVGVDHDQTFTKVNAPVDAGIAEIVDALSLFPRLCTTASCEGNGHVGGSVDFRYGSHRRESVDFLVWLGRELGGRMGYEDHSLTAQWGGGGSIDFRLVVPRPSIGRVSSALRELASQKEQHYSYDRTGALYGEPRP